MGYGKVGQIVMGTTSFIYHRIFSFGLFGKRRENCRLFPALRYGAFLFGCYSPLLRAMDKKEKPVDYITLFMYYNGKFRLPAPLHLQNLKLCLMGKPNCLFRQCVFTALYAYVGFKTFGYKM